MTKQEIEKLLVGKNIHSVYLHCLACNKWGIPGSLSNQCGNCNNITDTHRYYDSETIANFLKQKQEELKNATTK